MKTIALFLGFVFLVSVLQAQSVMHYKFNGTMEEAGNTGPTLTVLGNEGVFVVDTLDKINSILKMVYRFGVNSGFQFSNVSASGFIGHSYTIELYMKLDELNSWKRVVDWKNRKSDYGAYVYDGRLNFYDHQYSEEAPVVAGEYTYYVITRDSASQELLIYSDAEVKISFIDADGDALLDEDQVLNFFHDDLEVPNEATSGSVAMLKIYSYKMEPGSIQNNFNEIGNQIFSVPEISRSSRLSVYPNPASDELQLELSGFNGAEPVILRLTNTWGQLVLEEHLLVSQVGHTTLSLPLLKNGVYLLSASTTEKSAFQKIVIGR